MASNDITVNIVANTKKFQAGIASASKGLKGFADRTRNFVKQNRLAILGAAAAVTAFAFKATKAASDLEETQAKFNTVFRGVTVEAEKSAAILQESFLLSEEAAKKNLAAIQDTLVPMGLMRDEAQNISFEVVKLAADLGSFNNLPTEQVMRDIQSALVGNFETMKKYGVVLRATDVQNRILNKGLAENAGAITNAQRVTEAYKLILEGTKDAQGDINRTSNSFANQMKLLEKNVADLMAKIGEGLIPIFKAWVRWANIVIKVSHKMFKTNLDNLSVNEINIIQQREKIRLAVKELAAAKANGAEFGKIADQARERIRLAVRNLAESKKMIQAEKDLLAAAIAAGNGIVDTATDTWTKVTEVHDAHVKGWLNQKAIQQEFDDTFTGSILANSTKWTEFAKGAADQVFSQFGSGVADMILESRKFSDVMKSIWKDLARAIIAQISQMIARWLVFNAITGGFTGGTFVPIGKFLGGGQHGGIIGEPSIIKGMKTGKSAIVGEAGPEAIVPMGGSGGGGLRLTPPGVAGQLAGGGGINLTLNISGQFIEASPAKWAMLFREKILPEVRRFTMVAPTSPFTRRRGAA